MFVIAPQALELLEALPERMGCSYTDLDRELENRMPLFNAFVATRDGVLLGAAIVVARYSSWSGRRVFLQGFTIREGYRREGIGTMLMETVAQFSLKYSAEAMEWVIRPEDEGGRIFSERIGAHCEPLEQWHDCDWDAVPAQ